MHKRPKTRWCFHDLWDSMASMRCILAAEVWNEVRAESDEDGRSHAYEVADCSFHRPR